MTLLASIFTIFLLGFLLSFVSIEKIYQTLRTVFGHISGKYLEVRQKYSTACTRSFVFDDVLHEGQPEQPITHLPLRPFQYIVTNMPAF